MNKITQIRLSLALLSVGMAVYISGCTKDEPIRSTNLDNSSKGVSQESAVSTPKSSSEDLRTLVASMNTLDPVAVEYCNNVRTLLAATDGLSRPTGLEVAIEDLDNSSFMTGGMVAVAPLTGQELLYSKANDKLLMENSNPMSLKLNSLRIIDEDKNTGVNFFDLPESEKQTFVDYLLVDEAKDLSDRIERVPELKELLEKENTATNNVIQKLDLSDVSIGESLPELRSLSANKSPKKVNAIELFKLLQEEIVKEYTKENKATNKEQARFLSFGSKKNYPVVKAERVRDLWARTSRRGDFILALPNHGFTRTYFNSAANFSVGHAGVLVRNVTSNMPTDAEVSIEAFSDRGVQLHKIKEWPTLQYVMGIQHVSYRWRWRGFRSGFYKQTRPVDNPELLASWAEAYKGRSYVTWYEFPFAKWAAPSRFTCTTLVWWAAKRAYGINLSPWYTTLVTPSALLSDKNTYIRGEIGWHNYR